MFGKSRALEQVTYLEDLVMDLRGEVRTLQDRVKLLEERAVKEDIKKFNKTRTKKTAPKKKVAKTKQSNLQEKVVFGRYTERAAQAEIAKYEKKGYKLYSKKNRGDMGFEVVMVLDK